MSASEYLSQRLNDEQETFVTDIQSIVYATTEEVLISAGRKAVNGLTGEAAVQEFVSRKEIMVILHGFKPYHYVHDLALDSLSLREVCPWSALRGIYLN